MAGVGHTQALPDAPPILSNVPGSFAWGVLHRRHPQLVNQIRDAFPYPLDQDHALDRLGQESSVGVITPLGRHAPDREVWDGWGRDYFGQRWIDVPFLWAESYFYRNLLDVIGFFEPGPWAGIDPFEPFKNAELNDASLVTELAALDRVLSLPADERASALVHASLWGNRADLGFRISASPEPSADEAVELVADDTPAARRRLLLAAHDTFRFLDPLLPRTGGSAAHAEVRRRGRPRRTGTDDEQVLTTLDSTGEQWRTNGTHALIQVRP